MSPSDLGEILKPFRVSRPFDYEGAPFSAGLHPHSGIAAPSYVVEGAVSYVDPDNVKGTLAAGGVEWMQAGRGMWHGGGLDKQAGRAASSCGSRCRRNSNWVRPSACIWPRKMCRKTVRRAFLLGRSRTGTISSSVPFGPHSAAALARRQAHLAAIRTRLVQEGRL